MASRDAVSDLIRGNIDAIILKTLSKGDSYGYEILKSIGTASLGEYEMKERRKYYRLTDAGAQELVEATERWERVRGIIDRLLIMDGSEQ